MKTPRELLLKRHASANEKLDAIREQVLAAEGADEIRNPQSAIRNFSALLTRWRELLCPSPKAWAGLAAVWIVIFGLQFAARDTAPALARNPAPPSPQVVAALQQQKRLLAELIGQSTPVEAMPPKSFSPRPRSEVRHENLSA